jgi:hypothetical protein
MDKTNETSKNEFKLNQKLKKLDFKIEDIRKREIHINDERIPSDVKIIKKKKTENNDKISKKKKICIIVISTLASIVILAAIIILIKIFVIAKKRQESEITDGINFPIIQLESEPEFLFKMEIGQLNRIQIDQKYNEITKRNGKDIPVVFHRNNILDIYIISVREANEKERYFYSKVYTCAISIVGECISNSEEKCEPKTILDLAGNSIPQNSNIRRLNEEELEKIPIPLCLFNITDNNAITSIKCPKSISEGKIKGMVLDLYFFRPSATKRLEDINVTKNSYDIGNGNQFIRDSFGGICKDFSNYESFCSTDVNITKDSNQNLVNYSEVCFSNIIKDENNSYIKTKETKLVDISEKKYFR